MAGAKIIKQLLAERDINVNELAEKLKIKPQSMSNKLYRDNFSFQEMCNICNILNADLKAITRDSQKEFYESYFEPSSEAMDFNPRQKELLSQLDTLQRTPIHQPVAKAEAPRETLDEKLERIRNELNSRRTES